MNPALFDDQSPFVQRDNRRFRPLNPTTADLLNRRHEALLPHAVVAGRSVLDIGCALAATGKWVLDREACGYVGVEPQKEYADTAAELLARYPNATVLCERGEQFFSGSDTRYDVVALIGVLHGQYNPLSFLETACSIANDYVCIETPGHDLDGASMTPVRQQRMPVAGRNAEFHGFGWRISPMALSLVMEHLGFLPDMAPEFLLQGRYPRYAYRFRRSASRTVTAGEFKNAVDWETAPARIG